MRTISRRRWMVNIGSLALAGAAWGCFPASLKRSDQLQQANSLKFTPIHFDHNENPYGPSEKARFAMVSAVGESNRYPWRHYAVLRQLIADRENISSEQVVLGAGSEEILRMAGMLCALEKGEVVTPHPTYELLEKYSRSAGGTVRHVLLDSDFQPKLEAMDRAVGASVRLVYICNPNNPTGIFVPTERLKPFCEEVARRAIVLVDEAYHEYVEAPDYRSMVCLVRKGHRVIVTRTFSKIHGLAGLRIGYAMTHPDIAKKLRNMQTVQGVNIIALRAAIASYNDFDFRRYCRLKNTESRLYVQELFDRLGYRYLPSHTNFILFEIGREINWFRDAMRERGVLVGRPFPPLSHWCRVSLGTIAQMRTFASAFRHLLAK